MRWTTRGWTSSTPSPPLTSDGAGLDEGGWSDTGDGGVSVSQEAQELADYIKAQLETVTRSSATEDYSVEHFTDGKRAPYFC